MRHVIRFLKEKSPNVYSSQVGTSLYLEKTLSSLSSLSLFLGRYFLEAQPIRIIVIVVAIIVFLLLLVLVPPRARPRPRPRPPARRRFCLRRGHRCRRRWRWWRCCKYTEW